MNDRSVCYSAGLMSESPWFHEFKKMVFMTYDKVAPEEIRRRCVEENMFGMPKAYRALRTYGYLLNRINLMDDSLVELFCTSDLSTQKLINFITVIMGDRLFFEFVNEVYRDKVQLGYSELTISEINVFFTDKSLQDEDMKAWKDTTFKRLRSGYFQFMTDANLLRKEKTRYLITPPVVDIALERYLQYSGRERFLKAIMGVR
ncbi:MAG: DUF1819 family protein [Oscillospiraceae bacterium]|nr:DUF1819 family protein [Oscillospiraceae bacterium]